MTAALAVLAGLVTAAGVAPPAAAGVSPGQTLRASVRSDQAKADQPSSNPSVSGDGRYVVFSSRDQLDTAALPDNTPSSQIFVRDLVAKTVRLLTFSYQGEGINTKGSPASGESDLPVISGSGRSVAIETTATDLASVSTSTRMKVVLIDRDPDGDGAFDEPVGDAIALTWTQLDDRNSTNRAFLPSISTDGLTAVWEEQAASGSQTQSAIVMAQLAASTPGPPTISVRRSLVPAAPAGNFLLQAWAPAISGNGKRVVAKVLFVPVPNIALAPAPTIPAAAAAAAQSVGDDVQIVAFDVPTEPDASIAAVRLDVFPPTEPLSHTDISRLMLSFDGHKAVFVVSVLPCNTCPFEPRAFIADPDPDNDGAVGPDVAMDKLSRNNAAEPVTAVMPAISADGRYAAFVTDAPLTHNGVDRPATGCTFALSSGPVDFAKVAQVPPSCQVVVRDLVLDRQLDEAGQPRQPGELATPSVNTDCLGFQPGDTCASEGIAEVPALAGDGSVVAYATDAQDLITDDDNGEIDIYARRFTPTMKATPTPVDFGGVQVGDTVNAGTVITAVGFGPLKIQSVAVTGTGFALGSQACVPRGPLYALDPASNCAVSVDYKPAGDGPQSGTIDITPAFGDPVHIPVSGVGTPFPQPDPAFSAQPNPVDFGERLIFTDSSATVVTVTNTGTRVLTIAAVSLPPLLAPSAPGDYRITANTCAGAALEAGVSCAVTLVHQPQGPGSRPAVLQIDQSTPVGVQPHLVQLLGAGTTPSIEVNPAVVPVGRITTVLGTGFPPGHAVTIRMPGFPELTTVTPDAAGRFAKAVLVFPNSVPGSRPVEVTVDGTTPAVGDSENLLVVPGSLGPPDFLVRR